MNYIVTQEEKTILDNKGNTFGTVEKLALVTSNYLINNPSISSFKNLKSCVKLLSFSTIEEAENVANKHNMLSCIFNFKPELVSN
jgi:hypothetical protein